MGGNEFNLDITFTRSSGLSKMTPCLISKFFQEFKLQFMQETQFFSKNSKNKSSGPDAHCYSFFLLVHFIVIRLLSTYFRSESNLCILIILSTQDRLSWWPFRFRGLLLHDFEINQLETEGTRLT